MKTRVANFRGPRVPEGRNLRRVPMVPKGRNLRRVPMGITRPDPKKSTGMGWVGLGLSLNSMGIFGLGTQRGL